MINDVYDDIAARTANKQAKDEIIRNKISEFEDLRLDFNNLDKLKPVECKMILIKYQVMFMEKVFEKMSELRGKLL